MGICVALCSDQELRSLELPLHLYLLLSPQLLRGEGSQRNLWENAPRDDPGDDSDEPKRQVHRVLYLGGCGSSPQREDAGFSLGWKFWGVWQSLAVSPRGSTSLRDRNIEGCWEFCSGPTAGPAEFSAQSSVWEVSSEDSWMPWGWRGRPDRCLSHRTA